MPSLTWTAEKLTDSTLRLAFAGQGGIGSDGNREGEQMRAAIRAAIVEHGPAALIVDLSGFEYRFGDWIGSVLVTGRALGKCRICVIATGETAEALRSLLQFSRLDQLFPLVGNLSEALACLSAPGDATT
jgi:hypothetical protein